MEKLNIAELLKDCPKGTKLYTPLLGECELKGIIQSEIFVEQGKRVLGFNKYGNYWDVEDSECILFPSKDNRDWSTFQRPFKDGDIVVADDGVLTQMFILKDVKCQDNDNYDGCCYFGWDFDDNQLFHEGIWGFDRLATEEEKEKLFKVINDNGYKWDPETKTLEKLIEPKFKVGDKIINKKGDIRLISKIMDDEYHFESGGFILFRDHDYWELVPNKFDISTLVPFESKVLVRTNNGKWIAAFYSHYDNDSSLHYCVVGGLWYAQCIPYKGNEYLLNTTNDCSEYYKTWE